MLRELERTLNVSGDPKRAVAVNRQGFPVHADSRIWRHAEPFLKLLIVCATAVLLFAAWNSLGSPRGVRSLSQTGVSYIWHYFLACYGLVVFGSLGWRLILWRRYRAEPAPADAELPSLSLIIPAYNEGALVGECIRAAAASDYPGDRFEIIAIDDGSTDDTWRHIEAAACEVGDRVQVTVLRHAVNRGKRQALHLGFSHARGDIWATTDSDSLLRPEALRCGVAPMRRDPRVVCVAGCVEALNAGHNLFTRFMKCYYSLSFKFVRAYQAAFDGVFCAPGALSLYRASAVRGVLGEWMNQRFLGQACATGEDRAMTNLLLREGGLTAYQQNAVVMSRAPESYSGMAKMFLRWARSNIRETIVTCRFLFTRFRAGPLFAFRLNMVLVMLSLLVSPVLISHSAALAMVSDGFVLRYVAAMLAFSILMAVVYYINERDGDWVWLLVYQAFSVACFSWVMPYAAMTLRNTGWLTRGNGRERNGELDEIAASAAVTGAHAFS
ncbi:MAG: glycosyltransferase family 2 protein [Planctomycetes bacterium]|nr:glycosyltransferase family 2 protein [Planctomycetota bacterium]